MSTSTPKQPEAPKKKGRPKSEAKAEADRRKRINSLTLPLPLSLRTKARALCRAEMTPLEILDVSWAVLATAKAAYLTEYQERLDAGKAQRQWAADLRAEAIRLRDTSGQLDDADALRMLATAKAVDVPLPDARTHHKILSDYTDAERKIAEALAPYRGLGGYTRVELQIVGADGIYTDDAPTYQPMTSPLDAELIAAAEGLLNG